MIVLPNNSIVEQMICSRDFPYLQPYFYNHPYALRCELGIGDSHEEYMANAKRRALEIYHILFPSGADAMMFNHWMYDYCDNGDAARYQLEADENMEEKIEAQLEAEADKLRFLLEQQFKYRHITVRDLEIYDSSCCDAQHQKRNRVICYSDGIGFNQQRLIEQEIEWAGHEVSFVSFVNECIFSVYDDRGCDVVFMTHEKLKEFYEKLQPYFLDYDREEMENRFNGK